jgi:carboxyl-terminal processing protease
MFTLSAAAALTLLTGAALKGTILLLAALVLAGCCRRASAASRHLVWSLALTSLVAVPLVSWLLPAWSMPWSVPVAPSPDARGQFLVILDEPAQTGDVLASTSPGSLRPAPSGHGATSESAAPVQDAPMGALPASVALVSFWLAGALLSALWFLGAWVSLRRLASSCVPVGKAAAPSDASLLQTLSEAARDLGVRRSVRLLLSSRRAIPMTWGLWRPVVLLPEEARHWTVGRLRMILTHEVGHVRRWDCLTQMLGHLVRGLYWFHPLAWLAMARLRVEQEQACDDLVLESGACAPEYAEHLVTVTAGLPTGFWTAPAALGMGRSKKIGRRVEGLLDAGRNRRPLGRHALLWGGVLALLLVVPLGTATFSFGPAGALADEPKVKVEPDTKDEPATAAKEGALLKKLAEVRAKLAELYVTPLDEKVLAEQALKGLLQGLKDPYTDYISPEDLNSFDTQLKGRLTGIGAQLTMVNDHIMVTTPLEGSPALKAGIRPGDLIEAIDGKSTRGMAIADAVKRILGPAGSVVKLKVVHPEGVAEEIPITRGEIRFRSVTGFLRGADGQWQFLLDADHKVGYLQVLQFSGRTAAEAREAILALQKDGLKGLILDLRSCPGGLLEQALEMGKLFLSNGVIVTMRGQNKAEHAFKADGKTTLGDFPLVVLVNEHTASAAEILAGALRDHDRAVLLGTRTYGKGSVQTIIKLDAGGALKVTTAYHYLPSGRNIQKRPGEKTWGVDPTDGFYFPVTAAQAEAQRDDAQKRSLLEPKAEAPPRNLRLTPKVIEEKHADPQLAAALRSLVARITGGEFLKVGGNNDMRAEQAVLLEEMRQRREKLRRNAQQLEREIADLEQALKKAERGK